MLSEIKVRVSILKDFDHESHPRNADGTRMGHRKEQIPGRIDENTKINQLL